MEDLFAQFEKETSGPRRIELATRCARNLSCMRGWKRSLSIRARWPPSVPKTVADLGGNRRARHAERLIAALGGAAASDADFDAHLKVLRNTSAPRAREENEISRALRATKLDLEKIGEASSRARMNAGPVGAAGAPRR